MELNSVESKESKDYSEIMHPIVFSVEEFKMRQRFIKFFCAHFDLGTRGEPHFTLPRSSYWLLRAFEAHVGAETNRRAGDGSRILDLFQINQILLQAGLSDSQEKLEVTCSVRTDMFRYFGLGTQLLILDSVNPRVNLLLRQELHGAGSPEGKASAYIPKSIRQFCQAMLFTRKHFPSFGKLGAKHNKASKKVLSYMYSTYCVNQGLFAERNIDLWQYIKEIGGVPVRSYYDGVCGVDVFKNVAIPRPEELEESLARGLASTTIENHVYFNDGRAFLLVSADDGSLGKDSIEDRAKDPLRLKAYIKGRLAEITKRTNMVREPLTDNNEQPSSEKIGMEKRSERSKRSENGEGSATERLHSQPGVGGIAETSKDEISQKDGQGTDKKKKGKRSPRKDRNASGDERGHSRVDSGPDRGGNRDTGGAETATPIGSGNVLGAAQSAAGNFPEPLIDLADLGKLAPLFQFVFAELQRCLLEEELAEEDINRPNVTSAIQDMAIEHAHELPEECVELCGGLKAEPLAEEWLNTLRTMLCGAVPYVPPGFYY